jgi:hypothetical protein
VARLFLLREWLSLRNHRNWIFLPCQAKIRLLVPKAPHSSAETTGPESQMRFSFSSCVDDSPRCRGPVREPRTGCLTRIAPGVITHKTSKRQDCRHVELMEMLVIWLDHLTLPSNAALDLSSQGQGQRSMNPFAAWKSASKSNIGSLPSANNPG